MRCAPRVLHALIIVNWFSLQGSALVEFDLARAEAARCEAVILLCDNLCSRAQFEDSGTILRALAMSKYLTLQNRGGGKIPIIIELRQVKGLPSIYGACYLVRIVI